MNLIGHNDVSAEQSVLGAILLDSDVLDEIVWLESRDFSLVRHQQMYQVMQHLSRNDIPVDLTTVTTEYSKFGRIEEMGGVSYLQKLAESCPTTANVVYYAKVVRSKAIRKRGSAIGREIAELDHNDYKDDEEYFAEVEGLASQIRPQGTSKMTSFSENKEGYFKHLTTEVEYIKTNFYQFDGWARGLWRGWLFVSAGRPSVGKTAKAIQRIYNVAKQKDQGVVLFWTQEMSNDQVYDRMISNITGIGYAKIKDKKLNIDELGKVGIMYDELEKLPIFMQDSSGVSIEEIRATARIFKKKYGKIAMIVVDYLQIMNIRRVKGDTRSEAIGNVTREAKDIARKMDCCFMMLSQMNRESEKKTKPQLSDLKESSSIEQDADVVEFLWHDLNDTDQKGKVIQQFVAKGRDIGIKEFRLAFQGWLQRFVELPKK